MGVSAGPTVFNMTAVALARSLLEAGGKLRTNSWQLSFVVHIRIPDDWFECGFGTSSGWGLGVYVGTVVRLLAGDCLRMLECSHSPQVSCW